MRCQPVTGIPTHQITQAVTEVTFPGNLRGGRVELYQCPHCQEIGGSVLMRKHIPRCPKLRRKPTQLERAFGAIYVGRSHRTGSMGLTRPNQSTIESF